MSAIDYDRYYLLNTVNNVTEMMPFVVLPTNTTDKFEYWNINSSRYDKFAQKYYQNPFYDFLIGLGNPTFESEWDIPDNTLIRIPFPLSKAKSDYETFLKNYL
jgi:hypothetical protein